MPSKEKVDSWGIKNLSDECNEDDEVTLVHCATCCNYYSSGNLVQM